ncbi:MAG TPA: glycosyltransferase family 2 protein, partial [Cyclobacteriaceae bacterium]|nr:glycosyltransferase family 2 protein [Cyclobacteriaceae bacterium]
RGKCIEDAGGWNFDTLTEDLDLSYRAQLKGWKFKYLEEVETPGELPILMDAIKSQQYRWNKGGAETARKNFRKVLASKLPFVNKMHAFFHLFNSSVFVCLLMAAMLSVPMLFIKNQYPQIGWVFDLGLVFIIGFLSITLFYWVSTKRFYAPAPSRAFLSLYPRFLIVSMGLSLHNGIAVLEGLLGHTTPFIRTPKFNVMRKGDAWKGNDYVKTKLNAVTILEGALCLYFLFGMATGVYLKDIGLLFFHLLLMMGFGSVFYYSVKPGVHA